MNTVLRALALITCLGVPLAAAGQTPEADDPAAAPEAPAPAEAPEIDLQALVELYRENPAELPTLTEEQLQRLHELAHAPPGPPAP